MVHLLVEPKCDPRKPLIFLDLHVPTYWRHAGAVDTEWVTTATWVADPSHSGNEIALKPGALQLLEALKERGCQLAVSSDYRFGSAEGLKKKLTMLGVEQFFCGYLSMPEIDWQKVRYADESLGKNLLRALRSVTSQRPLLVGQFAAGPSLLELYALGIITLDEYRSYAGRAIREMPGVMDYLNQRFCRAFVTEKKREPSMPEQWAAVLADIDQKLYS